MEAPYFKASIRSMIDFKIPAPSVYPTWLEYLRILIYFLYAFGINKSKMAFMHWNLWNIFFVFALLAMQIFMLSTCCYHMFLLTSISKPLWLLCT